MNGDQFKMDLRIKRTYKLLINAIRELLNDRPYDKITVTDICEVAMINRATFYKHFEDKYHLLMFAIKEMQDDFNSSNLNGGDDPNNPKPYYLRIFRNVLEYLDANPQFHQLLLATSETTPIMSTIYQATIDDITSKLEFNESIGLSHSIPISVIANFYAGALISTTLYWLKNKHSVSIDEMVYYVEKLINESGFIN